MTTLGSLSNYDGDDNNNFKNNRFNDQNSSSARASLTLFSTFLWCPLHDYDVKPPNLTLYGGCGHTTTNFPSSFRTWIKCLRIHLQEMSPAFDILSGSEWTRLSLKERKFIFLKFSLPSSSSLLKVPIIRGRYVRSLVLSQYCGRTLCADWRGACKSL